MDNISIADVCREFGINGDYVSSVRVNDGIINTTYRVKFSDKHTETDYVVQKINSYVFKKPQEIMSNIELVTKHIADKLGQKPHIFYFCTRDGKNYYKDKNGDFWRICNCIESATYNTCENLELLYGAGCAFGKFQKQLSDFDASQLYETIADFHNTKKRLEILFKDIENDEFGRVNEVKEEIDFICSVREKASILSEMLEAGELPLRVTHNDTKINNVLFEKETSKPIAVIDLDTVMPGLAAYDFGDAVRSAANDVSEDEEDITKVNFNIEKFKAFTEGFIEKTKSILSDKEKETLPLGAFTMATELAVRFLDDYITGDKYFQIKYPEHNLVRARGQIALAKDILKKFDEMNSIVENI